MPKTPSYKISQAVKRQRTLAANMRLPANPEEAGLPAFFIKVVALGATANKDNPEELMQNFVKYLRFCEAYNEPIGNIAAYASIGMNMDEVSRIEHGKLRANDPRYRELIRIIKNTCAAYRETLQLKNKIAPATGIWLSKQHDGMKDVQEIVLGSNDPLGEKKDPAEILERYKDIIKQ